MNKYISIFLTSLLVTSCSNDGENIFNEDNTTSQIAEVTSQYEIRNIEKIETVFNEKSIKLEGVKSEGPKNETIYPGDFKDELREKLDADFSKQESNLRNAGKLVGVFKNGTCGQYKTFSVFMDCEDSKEASSVSGWHGDSSVDRNGNVWLHFCAVNDANFERQRNKIYGLLRLTSTSIPGGVSHFRREFDNEDSDNKNEVIYDGVQVASSKNEQVIGYCKFGRNTVLSFYFYNSTSDYLTEFPNLGIQYGVLGTFAGLGSGFIYTDDEDSSNKNWASVDEWNDKTYQLDPYYFAPDGNFKGLMELGINTRLFVTRVK